MRRRYLQVLISAAAIGALILAFSVHFATNTSGTSTAHAQGFYAGFNKIQQRILSGFASNELNPTYKAPKPISYYPTSDDGCPQNLGSNVKLNHNCLNISDPALQGRGQAQNETSIAQDPYNPNHLVGSSNDYRRGDGNCYAYYSLDGGQTWADSTVPMSFTLGANFGGAPREYWQAGGDTSVAWDTKGNAYIDCQVFNRGAGVSPNPDQSSAVYVFRSTLNGGASWNFTGRPVIEHDDTQGAGNVLEDKPLMTVDNHKGSPFQDRIYTTYTEFAADGTAYIWESYSANYGETFSQRTLVSSDSSLCPNTYGLPTPQGRCNENQFSQPFTGPDGALYVAYSNFNNSEGNANDNHYQILLVKSTDGGVTFGAPVLVGTYYDLPDCAAYQNGGDAGRACVPEKGSQTDSIFRATNYASGAVNPTSKGEVVVTYGSYINKDSKESNGCVPQGFSSSTGNPLYTGVKTAGACNNKILVSVSSDGGNTFTGGTTDPRQMTIVNQQPGQKKTDQWWQWAAYTTNGKLAVSYYDRQYANDETSGQMDFSLSGTDDVQGGSYATVRVTTGHLPLPTQFPDGNGNSVFFGDYTGLTAATNAFPIWMDTRDKDLFLCPGSNPPALCTMKEPNGLTANDQEIFARGLPVPTP
jgi:hypothetical protein